MNYLRQAIFLLLIMTAIVFITKMAFAGDSHQRTQSHRVVYFVTDSSGKPVTGQTVRLQVQRVSDDAVLDFSDNTFKFSSWTTRYATMPYNAGGEYYMYTISIDSSRLVSGDYVCIVSNDDATYGDRNGEVVNFDTLNDLIKMNR